MARKAVAIPSFSQCFLKFFLCPFLALGRRTVAMLPGAVFWDPGAAVGVLLLDRGSASGPGAGSAALIHMREAVCSAKPPLAQVYPWRLWWPLLCPWVHPPCSCTGMDFHCFSSCCPLGSQCRGTFSRLQMAGGALLTLNALLAPSLLPSGVLCAAQKQDIHLFILK